MATRGFAIVREVAGSFAAALSAVPPDPPIDVARARAQHAAYVAALRDLGLEVVRVDADEACPDGVFVEDTAVVAGEVVVLTRPGTPSRRPEVSGVARVLAARAAALPAQAVVMLWRMEEPATLDGGDCLRLESQRTIYVGRSERTNAAGAAFLRAAVRAAGWSVVEVAMPPGVLHLKSVCSPLDARTVVVAEGTLPAGTFGHARVLEVPRAESAAANLVSFAGAAIVAADGVETARLVEAEGFRVVRVDTSEMRKADGALTCLSVIVESRS
jgi:dimethylargininase